MLAESVVMEVTGTAGLRFKKPAPSRNPPPATADSSTTYMTHCHMLERRGEAC